ncbi:MAG: hypothetical protein IJZ71_08215 [Treponema sp.]|nr:hypothetical protein [Treponema sp.]
MKKILVLLLAVLTLIAFVACDTGNGSSSPVGTGTESESGNTGSGSTGGSTGSEGGNTGSGSTGGNGSSSTGGTGSGSTEGNISYVGTWTVTMAGQVLCITLNADGTCVAYNSDEGFAEANWNVTNSGVTITIPGEGSLSGRLDNGNLVVNYGQDVPLTKVDTAAYVGTWTGSMGGATLSITLNADGTMSGYSPIMEPTNIDGFWTVTNDGVMIGADVGDEDPEEGIIPGALQGDKLVINFNGQIELTK